jgi:hypothetical protein
MSTRPVGDNEQRQDRHAAAGAMKRVHDRVVVELPPLLAGPALATAQRWADRVLSSIRQESRRVCGGWPGTLTEARTVLAEDLLPGLTDESLAEFERVGHDPVARFLYQGAREYWARREDRRVAKALDEPASRHLEVQDTPVDAPTSIATRRSYYG